MVATSGDVMVWGDNTCMALGISTRASGRKRPFPVALIDKTAPSGLKRLLPKCKQVVASGVHTVAVTVDGDLYSWGVNDEGQLGRPIPEGDDEAPAVPGLVSLGGKKSKDDDDDGNKVTSAVATDAATFALTEGGTVYGTGVFKDDGEVGFSPENTGRQQTPTPMAGMGMGHAPVAAMAAGNTHLVLLTEAATTAGSSGGKGGKAAGTGTTGTKVLTAGAGGQGQLGRVGQRLSQRTATHTLLAPAPVKMPRGSGRPVAVFAGGWHTMVITDTDKVVGWGLNNWGQLGIPVTGGCVYTPVVIKSLSGIGVTQLACGEHHTLALKSDGTVLSFGRAAYGRLGRPAGVPLEMGDAACAEPAAVTFPFSSTATAGGGGNKVLIVSVSAGMKESAAVDDDGVVYCWGSGSGNMQGRGDDEDDVWAPEAIPEKEAYPYWRPREQKIVAVSMGAQHVAMIASPGHKAP